MLLNLKFKFALILAQLNWALNNLAQIAFSLEKA